jgi:DegV family protein with EDD domain
LRKVAVITDSVACLTQDLVKKYDIGVVPLYINYKSKAYRDWVDLTPNQAYELFKKNPGVFTTSTPSPSDFLNTYKEAAKKADSIFVAALSTKISSTYNSAVLGAEMVAKELPGVQVKVLDSLTATAAEGFIALAAARAAESGLELDDVTRAAEDVKNRVYALVLLDTIKYVYRSGRVPKIAAQFGSTLNLHPLLNVSGRVNFVAVARSREKGIELMLQKIKASIGDRSVHMSVMHAYAEDAALRLQQRVAKEFNCIELWLSEFSPIMGYACGTGTLGIAFYTED